MILFDDVKTFFSEQQETFSDESIRKMTALADQEMVRRSVPGIVIFFIVFIITTFITHFPSAYPVTFSVFTLLLVCGLILRIVTVVSSNKWRLKNSGQWRLFFFSGILITAMAWGGYLAAIVFVYGITLESLIPIIYTAGIAAGSVSSFCMRRIVVYIYVIAMLVPVIFGGIILRTSEAINISLAIFIFLIWSFVHCRRLFQDFWKSLVSNHLLELQTEKLQQAKEMAEQTSRRLEVTGAEMTAILDHSPVGIVLKDSEQKISHVNPEMTRLTGYSREELINGALNYLFSSREEFEAFEEEVTLSLKRHGVFETDKQLQSKEGSLTWCHIYGRVFELEDSKPGIIWTLQDITKRKETEAEKFLLTRHLEQTQRLESLNVMAGAVAHHFNNIMMGLSGNLELLEMQAPPDSKIGKMATNARKAAARASKISDSMLTYIGQRPIHKEAGHLSGLVKGMEELLRDSVGPRVTITYQLASRQGADCEFDESQIRQVILNLVLNANESIGDSSGEIKVSTGSTRLPVNDLPLPFRDEDLPPGQYVFCEISDSGTGMDAYTRERMFDPFFSTRFTGRGLGLAVVTGIVKAHNGALTVKSCPDEGTTITLLLPRAEKGEVLQPETREDHETDGQRPVFSGVVLLADDDLMVTAVGSAMLNRLGLEVLTAVDGQEAVDLYTAQSETVCLVILDVSMPRKDGITALQELKEINEEVKVILVSGYGEDQIIEGTKKKHRPNGFLHKPFRLQELADTIHKVLSEQEDKT